ncbi:MAG: uracil-DNA glycosylase family protein [Pseudomonadota bacterium]
MNPADQSLPELVKSVRACRLCEDHLPEGPNPVFQIDRAARILIAGQAPGRRVHESGIPFDDPSGDRLRDWLGVTREIFYDPTQIALLPMGFCYPGTGKSGDLPPRRECEPAWRPALLQHLTALKLTLVVGQYAIKSHLPDVRGTLTNTVQHWKDYGTRLMPLPHPSPRNNIWLKKNPWFEAQLLPELRLRVSDALAS